ncbi:hypothetical protein DFA_05581 [Cavenderia fasciculata]|uniref:SAC domain-containing protein n=1 Tax=Cavenderia fasciculata TaxID=261658 RepID=F4PLM6_CACFS|nr:uncharacterized protein DFA_05581 [Cavenderia fasciculata]EGG23448.1 hypothetical protein DFA_05581 [Cavenderia fasciculata]|eukprot:XP_004361299.1 hypothetical protein DFA_05581 [Cavenderia fasciculata]
MSAFVKPQGHGHSHPASTHLTIGQRNRSDNNSNSNNNNNNNNNSTTPLSPDSNNNISNNIVDIGHSGRIEILSDRFNSLTVDGLIMEDYAFYAHNVSTLDQSNDQDEDEFGDTPSPQPQTQPLDDDNDEEEGEIERKGEGEEEEFDQVVHKSVRTKGGEFTNSMTLETPVIDFLTSLEDDDDNNNNNETMSPDTEFGDIQQEEEQQRNRSDSLDNNNFIEFEPTYHELVQEMTVSTTKDKIIIRPRIPDNARDKDGFISPAQLLQQEYIIIDRNTFDITLVSPNNNINNNSNNDTMNESETTTTTTTFTELIVNSNTNTNTNAPSRSSSPQNITNNSLSSSLMGGSINANILLSTGSPSTSPSTSPHNSFNYNNNNNNSSGRDGTTSNNGSGIIGNTQFIVAYGIIGVIKLISGPHLILITEKKLVGNMGGKSVYEIDQCHFLPIATNIELGEHEKRLESTHKKSLKSLLNSDFYFSYQFDLSNSLQRTSVLNQYDKVNHLFEKFEDRFYWNRYLQQQLIDQKMHSWILPIIRGHVEVYNFFLDGCSFEFGIISRRSKVRAGTRYNTRGSDQNGSVANYVETEQILNCTISNQQNNNNNNNNNNQNNNNNMNISTSSTTTTPKTFSLIQIRGSIPLLWEQSGYKIKPVIKINNDQNLNIQVFKSHFNQQISFYGPQTIVTLLDQKGSESELGDLYKQTLKQTDYQTNEVDFFGFDFHHFCQGGRFDRVEILIDNLEEVIDKIGYLERDPTGYQSYQNGSIRTNCLDCLDRTNLVQSMIGLKVLESQFQKVGVDWRSNLQRDATTSNAAHVLKQIKLSWANNGDAISRQYAGTSALKGDFTRTGKRNTKGVFKDGVNSLTRYYINTFQDKLRQISIDLLLGINTIEANTMKVMASQKDCDWGESRMKAINNCVDHFLQYEKDDQSGFINAWIVISINKRNQEQERIFLLTPTHMVRCKYNFNENKIVHYKQVHLSTLKKIQKGFILSSDGKKLSYGMRIYYDNNKSMIKKSSAPSSSSSNNGNGSNGGTTNGGNTDRPTSMTSSSSGIKIPQSTNARHNTIGYSTSPPPPSTTSPLSNGNGNGSQISLTSSNSSIETPTKQQQPEVDMAELKDLSYQTYIVPIPEGESIDFGKDLVTEMGETIKECFSNLLGYSSSTLTALPIGQSFIFEKDFRRKTNTFGAAYNGLKLGFYSKSPTIGTSSMGIRSRGFISNSNNGTNSPSNTNNNNSNSNNNGGTTGSHQGSPNVKRRSCSFDATAISSLNTSGGDWGRK